MRRQRVSPTKSFGINLPILDWSVADAIGNAANQQVMTSTDAIIEHIAAHIGDDDAVIVMSNGGFEGIHGRLVKALQQA